jgi:DNA-binding Lrp family transcriptional regulator
VDALDSIDKNILLALDSNCRLSYKAIAQNLGMTANAVRKRMERLLETGVIEEFSIILKSAMMKSEYLIALVLTDGSENEVEFIETMGSNLHIIQVGQVVTHTGRAYLVHCEYISAESLQSLGSFFRTLKPVTDVQLHTILMQRGKVFEIKKLHLRILRYLLENARMQVTEISERTGLTARRVSRAIQELQESDAIWFATRWNLSLGGNTEFYLKIDYDETTGHEEVEQWLRTSYPLEYWFSFSAVLEPVLFAKFVTEHFRDAEHIARRVKMAPFSKSVDVWLSYPVIKFPRLGRQKLEEMITDAGF